MLSMLLGTSLASAMGATSAAYQTAAQAQASANAQNARAAMLSGQNAYSSASLQNSLAIPASQRLQAVQQPKPVSVAGTAASRVKKADWEVDEDRKDAELDAWIEGLGL